MSAFDRLTASRAKVRVLVGCVGVGLLAGLAIGVVRQPAPIEAADEGEAAASSQIAPEIDLPTASPPAPDAPASPEPSPSPEPPRSAAQSPPSEAPTTQDTPADPAEAPSEPDIVEAHQAAADFAAAYATYSHEDSSNALVERVRPFVTAELAAELARNSGAAAGRAELEERQQQAAGAAFTVHTDDAGEGYVDVLVTVRQEVTWDGGGETRWPTYLLRISSSDDGWRVSGLLR